MVCNLCEEKPVIKLVNNKRGLCKTCFIKYFDKKVLKTIKNYKMFDKKDKVLVCVSGGKDSTVLLDILRKIRNIEVEAIVIDALIGDYTKKNIENIVDYCKEKKIKLHNISLRDEFGYSLCYIKSLLKKKGLNYKSCTICGILRRYLINKYARELKFDKVATGHNLDDEAQSFFMNVVKNNMAVSARMGPVAGVKRIKSFIPRVKPLYFLMEKETKLYSKLKKFKVYYERCPCSSVSFRKDVGEYLDKFEDEYNGSKYGVVNSFLGILDVMKEKYSKGEVKLCKCGEPCSLEVCKTCEILGKMN
ncbi:TIGR00269 family protein [archaeon]|nr:TIGR00269 family protein [archaeon]|tara:strand:+ start:31 stop:942 length:912 start_codon:yes stop_codon:yes gene_type:complete